MTKLFPVSKKANRLNKTRTNNDLSKQTVIYILSESYADPRRVPSVKLSSIRFQYGADKKQNTSGLMYSSGYGGGTANIELKL